MSDPQHWLDDLDDPQFLEELREDNVDDRFKDVETTTFPIEIAYTILPNSQPA